VTGKAAERKLLVVEDHPGLRRQFKWAFDDITVLLTENRESAIAALHKHRPGVALVDLGLPPDADGPTEGLNTLRQMLEIEPEMKVIIMTGQREREYALQCIDIGAFDYYEKPIDFDMLALVVGRAFKILELERESRASRQSGSDGEIEGLETCDARMRQVVGQVANFAKANVAVLVTGESGTGKEVVARGLHQLSGRTGPYVAINCAAIPDQLLESELFGYERGAFTGAHKTTIGKVEQANGGTLVLDEIGDLPAALQAKLLRVLQERKIERIGGRQSIDVDIRLVSLTNRDLRALTESGAFREDLYYRLGEVTLDIPPLRERPDDAVMIARSFLKEWVKEQHLPACSFTPEALNAIVRYEWPGNVRELQGCIKRAALSCKGRITPIDLGLEPADEAPVHKLKDVRRQAELAAVQAAMAKSGDNISEAARLLDVSRPTLYELLRELKLKT
jgi:two-component system NtrC family response regulator